MNHPIPPSAFATLQFINPGLPESNSLRGNPSFTTWCKDSAFLLTFDDREAARAWFAAGLALCVDAAPEAAPADDLPVLP